MGKDSSEKSQCRKQEECYAPTGYSLKEREERTDQTSPSPNDRRDFREGMEEWINLQEKGKMDSSGATAISFETRRTAMEIFVQGGEGGREAH